MTGAISEKETPKKAPQVRITSMSQAGYLMMKRAEGVKLISGKRKVANPKEFVFLFEDPLNLIPSLIVDFMHSESRAFDNAVRDLRQLVNASPKT